MAPKIKATTKISKEAYKKELRQLQIELVKFQRHIITNNLQILVIFEGRDAAGKDGIIKRFIQHLSPREIRVVALGKPSDREKQSWYFERFVVHLPTSQEMVIMNRSWYNRAGVEHVMGFCNDQEYEQFLHSVIPFEHLLTNSAIIILKYYLDISKEEQEKRLKKRRIDPLSQWKTSPVDEAALQLWQEYSQARDDMLKRTHTTQAPWYVVRSDNKKSARLNVIRHFLATVPCPDINKKAQQYDEDIVFSFNEKQLKNGFLAP